MKILNKIFIFIGVITFIWLFNDFLQNSFAYSYDVESGILFYDDNEEVLQNNIKMYLEDIDGLLMANSNFELSDILVENYDFLTYFAFNYILNNYEYYSDKILELDKHLYIDKNFIQKSTNQYIDVEEIYKITDKYFGIRDYIFTDNNVNIINNKISLLEYANDDFSLIIDRVDVKFSDELVLAYVYYEGDFCYLYTFSNENEVLKIRNIEVIS